MSSWLAWALGLAFVLAGCSQAPSDNSQAPIDGLVATETAGILRGLVVNTAIHPLDDVAISIQGTNRLVQTTQTAKDGTWGFGDLPPGLYTVSAHLPQYFPVITTATVRANEATPPLLTIVVDIDASVVPYVSVFQLNGFLQCGVRGGTGGTNVCKLGNGAGGQNLTADRSQFDLQIDNEPDWIQGEMIWKASQPLSDSLGFYFIQFDETGSNSYMGIYPLNMGKSPLLLQVDSDGVGHCKTCTEKPLNMTRWASLRLTTNTGEMDATTPPPTCAPSGQPCLAGVGVTTNQKFDFFCTFFTEGCQLPTGNFRGTGHWLPDGLLKSCQAAL